MAVFNFGNIAPGLFELPQFDALAAIQQSGGAGGVAPGLQVGGFTPELAGQVGSALNTAAGFQTGQAPTSMDQPPRMEIADKIQPLLGDPIQQENQNLDRLLRAINNPQPNLNPALNAGAQAQSEALRGSDVQPGGSTPVQPRALGGVGGLANAAANYGAGKAVGAGLTSLAGKAGIGLPATPQIVGATAGVPGVPQVVGATQVPAAPGGLLGAITGQTPLIGAGPTTGFMGGLNTLPGVAAAINTANELRGLGKSTEETVEGITTGAGTALGAIFGGAPGAAVGSFLGDVIGDPLGKGVADLFGKRKGRRTQQQDRVKHALRDSLPNGRFSGVRGKELEITSKDVDYDDPLTGKAVALVDPISEALAMSSTGVLGEDTTELREDFGARIAYAVREGSDDAKDVKNNVLHYLKQSGITADQVRSGIRNSYATGNIDDARLGVYAATMAELTGGDAESELRLLRGI